VVKHLHPNFLEDEGVYTSVEWYWTDLWEKIDSNLRKGWKQPWFQPLPPSIGEGNPIFSAVSLLLRRGIRIIQYEPTDKGLEFVAYPDTFGGSIFDPYAIHELVISCALSDEAARIALSLMLPWVEGKAVRFDTYEVGLMATNDPIVERIFANLNLVSEAGMISCNESSDEAIFPHFRAA
jgi:hypothetical protein